MAILPQILQILKWAHFLPNIRSIMRQLYILFFILISCTVGARTIYDTEKGNIHNLFDYNNSMYVLRYNHQFTDTLRIPYGCELKFEGGSLKGPILFNATKLSGFVKLKGSVISGTIKNKVFDASWLCSLDGVSDDAPSINQIIEVCGKIYFPKGNYRLISAYDANKKVEKEYLDGIKAHIGIFRDNVVLRGEEGTVFITDKPLGTICVFSMPNQIDNSIKNVKIENISFNVQNDEKNFYEFIHTIKLIGVNGMTINNCTFNDFWGDAICLSHYGDNPKTGERTRNENVQILNNMIVGGSHHNNRNGISVINGKHILIKNNIIKNTSRKDMPGGIDIEPNNAAYTIDDIRVEENIIEGVRGVGGAIGLVVYDDGPAYNICIVGNKISDCLNGILVYVKTEGTTDRIVIKNNFVAWDTNPYSFAGGGKSQNWIVVDNIFEHWGFQDIPGNIEVKNLVVGNNKKKD